MRTKEEIENKIKELEKEYQEATYGYKIAMTGGQIALLCWVLGQEYTEYRKNRPHKSDTQAKRSAK